MKKILFLFLSIYSVSALANPLSNDIEIIGFTNQQHPFSKSQYLDKTYYLDKADKLLAQMSKGLPADPQQAEKIMRQRMSSPEWSQFIAKQKEASEEMLKGWEMGIKKVPAIVFVNKTQQNSVIYGVTNVAKAIQIYKTKTKQY